VIREDAVYKEVAADLIRRTVEAHVRPVMRSRNLEIYDEALSAV
jgi:hypothetical protein